MVTPAAGREAMAHLRGGFAMSERRACRVAAVDRSSVRYQRRRADNDRLRERSKALAEERRRFGYRRLCVLPRREGHAVNRKRVYRCTRQSGCEGYRACPVAYDAKYTFNRPKTLIPRG
jgi:putative transposase